MKSILRAVLAWLDRKFPDRVVVSKEDYEALLAQAALHKATIEAIQKHQEELDKQMEQVKLNLNQFSLLMGISTPRGPSVLER